MVSNFSTLMVSIYIHRLLALAWLGLALTLPFCLCTTQLSHSSLKRPRCRARPSCWQVRRDDHHVFLLFQHQQRCPQPL